MYNGFLVYLYGPLQVISFVFFKCPDAHTLIISPSIIRIKPERKRFNGTSSAENSMMKNAEIKPNFVLSFFRTLLKKDIVYCWSP